jgi:hypothetical protein
MYQILQTAVFFIYPQIFIRVHTKKSVASEPRYPHLLGKSCNVIRTLFLCFQITFALRRLHVLSTLLSNVLLRVFVFNEGTGNLVGLE